MTRASHACGEVRYAVFVMFVDVCVRPVPQPAAAAISVQYVADGDLVVGQPSRMSPVSGLTGQSTAPAWSANARPATAAASLGK